MRRAIFPGTFDPFTIGHYSVVQRTLTFMDEVVIGIGINENKNTYFPIEKRVEMIRKFYKDEPRIRVESYDCLTIDFARQVDARFIVRGIRTVKISNTKKPLPISIGNWQESKPFCCLPNRNSLVSVLPLYANCWAIIKISVCLFPKGWKCNKSM